MSGEDLGTASNEVFAAVARAGDPPAGVTVNVRGQVVAADAIAIAELVDADQVGDGRLKRLRVTLKVGW